MIDIKQKYITALAALMVVVAAAFAQNKQNTWENFFEKELKIKIQEPYRGRIQNTFGEYPQIIQNNIREFFITNKAQFKTYQEVVIAMEEMSVFIGTGKLGGDDLDIDDDKFFIIYDLLEEWWKDFNKKEELVIENLKVRQKIAEAKGDTKTAQRIAQALKDRERIMKDRERIMKDREEKKIIYEEVMKDRERIMKDREEKKIIYEEVIKEREEARRVLDSLTIELYTLWKANNNPKTWGHLREIVHDDILKRKDYDYTKNPVIKELVEAVLRDK